MSRGVSTAATVLPSYLDQQYLRAIRENVRCFLRCAARCYAFEGGRLLDVAPQDHEGAAPYFPSSTRTETLDIDPHSGCTHIGDITRHNEALADAGYDYVTCTEVLEHTLDPFAAIREIYRILKPGGLLMLSVPLNFRIHGPLPDCWRFTEHGLRTLLRDFEILELKALETPARPLMPIHYTVVARKPCGRPDTA